MLIACFNYMHLSTSRSASRLKEIGVRKIIGAGKKQIIAQILCETMVLTVTALIVSLFLIKIFCPYLTA